MCAADHEPDPSRGLAGYVTTYQGIVAAPELHLAEMRRRRTRLVVDEVHHLPRLADYEPGHSTGAADPDETSSWSWALLTPVRVRPPAFVAVGHAGARRRPRRAVAAVCATRGARASGCRLSCARCHADRPSRARACVARTATSSSFSSSPLLSVRLVSSRSPCTTPDRRNRARRPRRCCTQPGRSGPITCSSTDRCSGRVTEFVGCRYSNPSVQDRALSLKNSRNVL